jgi:hypothetical protein
MRSMSDHAMRTYAALLDEECVSKCAQPLMCDLAIHPNDFKLLAIDEDSPPAVLADWTEIRRSGSIK